MPRGQESQPQEHSERTWYCMGRRPGRGGVLIYGWLTHDGQEVFFKKFPHSAVGRPYAVQCDKDGTQVSGRPRWAGGDLHPLAPQWQLEDEATYVHNQQRLAERRLSQEKPVLDMTLRELQAAAGRSPAHRSAIAATVLRYLQ